MMSWGSYRRHREKKHTQFLQVGLNAAFDLISMSITPDLRRDPQIASLQASPLQSKFDPRTDVLLVAVRGCAIKMTVSSFNR